MLEGVKVLEITTMVAAPAAGCLMAEWGADVIKIEPHTGDPMRGRGGPLGSTNFDLHNREKRSIALNTRSSSTRDVILRLVKRADIFITNMLPDQLQKLSLDWDDLHLINPRMVYGTITGFGRVGPDRNRGAMDNAGFWARTGATHLQTVRGHDPSPWRQSVGDRVTGVSACAGILAAYIEAQRTGKGRLVDTSLMRSGVWAFSTDIMNQLNKGYTGSSKDRHHAVMALSNYYKTKDGKWLLLHTQLSLLAPIIGQPELAKDERFQTAAGMREHGPALVDIVDAALATEPYEYWNERFNAVGIIFEPVQSPAEIVADPQAQAAGAFIELPNWGGEEGTHREVASPQTIYDDDGSFAYVPKKPAPTIGQHTVEILQEVGYSAAEIEALRDDKAIPAEKSAA